nr:hypothetical protein [Tanacetum cinerariifolium]
MLSRQPEQTSPYAASVARTNSSYAASAAQTNTPYAASAARTNISLRCLGSPNKHSPIVTVSAAQTNTPTVTVSAAVTTEQTRPYGGCKYGVGGAGGGSSGGGAGGGVNDGQRGKGRVRESDVEGRIDRETRILFGFAGKIPPEKFFG